MTTPLIAPPRGFDTAEFEARTQALQVRMARENVDAVFLTTEPEFRYFSGFKSQFWESPTRPWYLVIPASGKPIAVVPHIGAAGMKQTWLDDIRSWPSPRPQDDGVSLLADTLCDCAKRTGRVGAMLGPETHLRMPADNVAQLRDRLSQCTFVDASLMIRALRSVKSNAEVAKIRFACEVTAAGFDYLLDTLSPGMTEREACKLMQLEMLRLGVDACPYLISASGQGGYDNIIMGPTDRTLNSGDILIIDTGANFDGYFSDFDRNYAFGQVDALSAHAYEAVFQATEAGLNIAAPGVRTGDVWRAMWSELKRAGALGNDVGRMGHGLGMQLTEWPSHVENGDVVLEVGMVLTLEPGMTFAPGKMMIHEDNILITETGCEVLHKRAWPELPVIR